MEFFSLDVIACFVAISRLFVCFELCFGLTGCLCFVRSSLFSFAVFNQCLFFYDLSLFLLIAFNQIALEKFHPLVKYAITI